jgi:hypothetical protein
MALTGGGGAANFEFNFDFHGMPSVKVVFGLYPPPVKIGPQLVLAEEYLKREFRYCGSHGPLLGSIVLKGELAGGGEYSLEGPKATAGYALGIEASLFRGAVKFGLPLMSINYVPELKFEWLMSQ